VFLGDATNTILLKTNDQALRVSILIRAIAFLYFSALLIRYRRGRKTLVLVMGLLLLVLLGGIAEEIYGNQYLWFENINLIFKLTFFFVCWEILRRYFYSTKDQDLVFKLFEVIILIQAATIILGFLLKLEIFSSYGQDYRFGYKGLIPAQNEVSGFFLIAIFYLLWKIAYKQKGIVLLLTVLIAGMLTGAKVALLFPLLLVLYLVIWTRRFLYKRIFWILFVSILIFLTVLVIKQEYIQQRLSPTFAYFNYQLSAGNNPNYFSIFMSGRDLYINSLFSNIFNNIGFHNILIGGHNLAESSTETDFLDIFLFIGFIGLIIFYASYFRLLFSPRNGKFYMHRLIFVITWLGVSLVAGHLLFSAINSMYLAILLLAYSKSNNNHILLEKNSQINYGL
jgi:hypothetical protein